MAISLSLKSCVNLCFNTRSIIDKKTMKDDPNYPKNKRVNLEYYAEDELEDIGVDDYS